MKTKALLFELGDYSKKYNLILAVPYKAQIQRHTLFISANLIFLSSSNAINAWIPEIFENTWYILSAEEVKQQNGKIRL